MVRSIQVSDVVRARARSQAALLEIRRGLSEAADRRPADPQAAAQCLVQGALAVVAAAELVAVLYPYGDALVCRSASNEGCVGLQVGLSGSAAGRCAAAGHTVRIDNPEEPAADPVGAAFGLRCSMLAPFPTRTGRSGVLQIACSKPGCFNDDDLLLAQLLAGMVPAELPAADLLPADLLQADLLQADLLQASLPELGAGGAAPPRPRRRRRDRGAPLSEVRAPAGGVDWDNRPAIASQAVAADWIDSWEARHRSDASAALSAAQAARTGHFRAARREPGGTPRWWDVMVTRLAHPAGAPSRLLSVARDITDLQEAAVRTRLALTAGTVIGIGGWEAGRVSLDERLVEAIGLPAEIKLTDFLRRVHPQDYGMLRALDYRARTEPGDLSATFRLRAAPGNASEPGGGWRWVEARGMVAPGPDGQPGRLTGVLIDVDARKRIELELVQNELTVRQVADSLPILLVYVAPDLTFRFANRAYIAWFGEPAGGYEGAPVQSLLGEAPQNGPGSLLERVLAGERIRFDQQVRRRGGMLCDVDVEYIPRRGGGGEFDGCYVIAIDITQRKEGERALSRSNSSLEQSLAVVQQESERVWGLSRDLLSVHDAGWRLRSVNPAWSSALGWAAETLLGGDCLELVHPDDKPRTLDLRRRLAKIEEERGFEARYRTRDGAYRWLSWNLVRAEGLIYGAARDVTVEKEAALRLQRVEEQLRQSQKMEAVGQLTGGIAHDFNNLLTGVIGSLEMMRTRVQQGRLDEIGKYMDAASGAAERAASVTHRLLAFSSRQTLDPKQVAADRLVHEMDELIRDAAGPVATLQIVRHPGLWPIFCDPHQLEIAVLNLVGNARDAMPEGGRLVIETANAVFEESEREAEMPAGEYVAVSVTDTGTGMSPEVAMRAFDPFFTTKPIGRGTGLGLSMVYGFARQSGGHARIVSAPGRGARVTIYLPRGYLGSELPLEPAAAAGFRGRTVLLVEDEPMVRMLVGEALAELDCTIIEAVDAAGGLRVLQSDEAIDLLITDFGLPGGMNGLQMASAAQGRRPELKVLFITGYAEDSILDATTSPAAMQVIGKPFTLEALTERVLSLMPL